MLLLPLCLRSGVAHGAGFMVQEKSPRGLGSAFAGEGALAQDAATVYFNPAGLTLLDGTQLVAGAHLIVPRNHFSNDGSTENPAIGHARLRGSNSEGGELAFIPTTYLTQELTPRLHVGLGVNAPFGLATEWDRHWVGRYHAIKSAMRTISILPGVGVRVFDWLSLGAGMSAVYAKATLTNAVDLGGVCAVFVPQGTTICPGIGLRPQHADGAVRITGDDWGFGWNVGALLTPAANTRIGLTYRSKVDLNLQGDADFTVPKKANVLKLSGALRDTGATAPATLPDVVSLSAFTQATPDWAVFADVTWTHWETFRDLAVTFDNPKQPAVVQRQGWTSSFRYALGTSYALAPRWTVRAGTAYDESPIASDTLRTPRIPDSDRVWASVGLGYQLTDGIRLDVGYAHVFGLAAGSANRDPVTRHVLRGTYDSSADILAAQASVRLW